jgi:hypothetical protein
MPVSGDRANFKGYWRAGTDPDQDNHDQHDHDGYNRMHRNAQRAMVGIAIGCMEVRYLDHSQKRD